MLKRLPAINVILVAALSAAFLLFLTNGMFWTKMGEYFGPKPPLFFYLFSAELYFLYFAGMLMLSAPYMLRPAYIFLFLVAAGAGYFTDTFGVMIDVEMIRNTAQTTAVESSMLMTPAYFKHMALYGLLPSLIIALIPISRAPAWRQIKINSVIILAALVAAPIVVFSNLGSFLPFWQHQREETMTYLNPALPIASTIDYVRREYFRATPVFTTYGTDAKLGPALANKPKPTILVLVIGETARAQNFSLAGYNRDTNPELTAMGDEVISYKDASACGTSTAVSLPCMFSHLGHDGYDRAKANSSENLVDVLKHAGLKVEWWENNTGPKGVANRIPTDMIAQPGTPDLCADGECLDEILMRKLERIVPTITENTVIVLHTMGSHGPGYFQRYPEEYRKFKPDCRTREVTTCPQDQVINAYDNTVVYTDHMLARAINILKARPDASTAMFFMSDHGESLGENGIYMHGAPYDIAPEFQKKIPVFAWFSKPYEAETGLNAACAKATETKPISHDNMFDTVLGMMDVQTSIYKRELDLYASCRTAAPAS